MNNLSLTPYLKAVYGAVGGALAATLTAYIQGKGHISTQAIISIVSTFWGLLGVIWGVPNIPKAVKAPPAA